MYIARSPLGQRSDSEQDSCRLRTTFFSSVATRPSSNKFDLALAAPSVRVIRVQYCYPLAAQLSLSAIANFFIHFLSISLGNQEYCPTFASARHNLRFGVSDDVLFPSLARHSPNKFGLCACFASGLTGFDSGQKRYVSMQCVDGLHSNLISRQLIGENNYALAA